jgi:hypothetical protein
LAPNKVITTITEPHGTTAVVSQTKSRVWMQIIVSLVLLFGGIFILTSPNFVFPHQSDEGLKRSAAGWIGAVVGYWLS